MSTTRKVPPVVLMRHLTNAVCKKIGTKTISHSFFSTTLTRTTKSPLVQQQGQISKVTSIIDGCTTSHGGTKERFHNRIRTKNIDTIPTLQLGHYRSISSSSFVQNNQNSNNNSHQAPSSSSSSSSATTTTIRKGKSSFRPNNPQNRHHHRKNNNRTAYNYNAEKFHHLQQYSQQFLRDFESLEYAHQTRGLAEHLRGWQPELSKLNPHQLEQILPLLDEMARYLMTIVPQLPPTKEEHGQTNQQSQHHYKFWKTPPYENEALLVTVPIHGYAKLQGYYSDRNNPQQRQGPRNQQQGQTWNPDHKNAPSSIEVDQEEIEEPYEKALKLLRCIEDVWEKTGDSRFQPLTESYSGVLDAMAKKCIDFYQDDNNDGNSKKNLQRQTQHQQQHQSQNHNNIPQQATHLLYQMLDMAKTTFNPLAQPSNRSWNSVLNAWATIGNVTKTMELYDMMQKEHGVIPDKFTHGIITKAWLRSSRNDASFHVRKFLTACIEQHRANPTVHPMPNEHVFASLIKLYCTGHPRQQQPDKAQEVLEEMQYWYRKHKQNNANSQGGNNNHDHDAVPMVESRHFIPVMSAWAKAGKPQQVEALLLQQQELYEQDGNAKCQPGYVSFVIILDAWSKQRTLQAARQAEDILYNIEEKFLIHDNTNDNDESNSDSHNTNVRRGQHYQQQQQQHSKSAPPQRMNSYAYNLVLDAYAHCGHVEKVEELFHRMEHMAAKYNHNDIFPDKVSYTSLMRSLIKEGKPGFVNRVESLLEQMESSSHQKPDTIAYACVLDALSKSGPQDDAGTRAESILNRMKEGVANGTNRTAIPNEICYNTLMNIYSKLGQPEKAEETLLWMEQEQHATQHELPQQMHNRHRLILTNLAYGTCMDAWAQVEYNDDSHHDSSHEQGDNGVAVTRTPLQHALDIYDRMLVNYQKYGNIKCKPTASTFGILFHALAKSKELVDNRLPLALDLFQQMDTHGIPRTTIVCNSFLAAISGTNSTDPKIVNDSLKECIMLFNTMRQSQSHQYQQGRRPQQQQQQQQHVNMTPDSTTYQKLLYAFDRLILDDPHDDNSTEQKNHAFLDLFDKCCHDGYMDQKTLALFKRFLPPELYHEKVIRVVRRQQSEDEDEQEQQSQALPKNGEDKVQRDSFDNDTDWSADIECLPMEWRRNTIISKVGART